MFVPKDIAIRFGYAKRDNRKDAFAWGRIMFNGHEEEVFWAGYGRIEVLEVLADELVSRSGLNDSRRLRVRLLDEWAANSARWRLVEA